MQNKINNLQLNTESKSHRKFSTTFKKISIFQNNRGIISFEKKKITDDTGLSEGKGLHNHNNQTKQEQNPQNTY